MTKRAFTLIELLIVVAIISILALIAVPNFLEAQTRAKVSAARSNLRVGMIGLESYRVDANRYPPTNAIFPDDALGIIAASQLRVLTTPLSYVSPDAFRDPFGGPTLYSQLQQIPAANPGVVDPNGLLPNPESSMLYIHFPSTAEKFFDTRLNRELVSLISIGPDREDSLGGYSQLPANVFLMHFPYSPDPNPVSTLYDPTNGTVSAGDVVAFGGVVTKNQ